MLALFAEWSVSAVLYGTHLTDQVWVREGNAWVMPNFSGGHFGMPGQIRELSVGAGFFEDEDYRPSFSILLGREELA